MKKFLCILIVLSILLSFASCTNDKCTEHADANNDGFCDKCEVKIENGDGGNNNVENGDKLTVSNTAFSVIYNKTINGEKEIAQQFLSSLKEKTGVELSLYDTVPADAEYKILFGTLNADKDVSDILTSLDSFITADSGAFKIEIKEKTLIVTATDENALSEASKSF